MSSQRKTGDPTGAGKKPALRVTFDPRLKLEFHGFKTTSDAGLLAYRQLDDALALTDLGENLLRDWRTGKNSQHSLVALMRQSVFSRLAGYEDTNDAERLAVDPTMRQVVGQFECGMKDHDPTARDGLKPDETGVMNRSRSARSAQCYLGEMPRHQFKQSKPRLAVIKE